MLLKKLSRVQVHYLSLPTLISIVCKCKNISWLQSVFQWRNQILEISQIQFILNTTSHFNLFKFPRSLNDTELLASSHAISYQTKARHIRINGNKMIWSVGWLNWRQFIVRRWWKVVPPSVWVHEWPNSILLKTSKSGLNVFWLLSVVLRGLGVHFCLGLHNVGKKKLLYFSSKNAKKDDRKRQKSDQKPLRRLSLYCSARARRTQWQRKLYSPRGKIFR